MGVEPPAARPTLADHLAADRLVHVIVAGGQDDQVARAGQHRELERAVRPDSAWPLEAPFGSSFRLVPKLIRAPATGRPVPSSTTLPRINTAPVQGQVDPMLDRPLGPVEDRRRRASDRAGPEVEDTLML